jgi:YVTN family beta-propeller protein
MIRLTVSCTLGVLFLLPLALAGFPFRPGPTTVQAQAERTARTHRPVALALAGDGKLLFVADQGGTITVMDAAAGRILSVVQVGRRLADLALTADGYRLLAVDEEANELVVLQRREQALEVVQRLAVSYAPVSIHIGGDRGPCCIASLWSRRLTVVDLPKDGGKPTVAKVIDLPFAPRRQLAVGNGKVLVADSYGGRLAIVDPGRGVVESVRTLPGHNIRGLALSANGKDVLVAHQVLGKQAHTTRDDIHWGNLITNNVRVLPLAGLLDPDANLLHGGRLYQLGDVGAGSADPAGLAVRPDGKLVVTLGGVGEVAIGPGADGGWERVRVGVRPTAVTVSPDGRRAFVANTFSDSISVVDLDMKKAAETSLGKQPEPTAAGRGERLFYDGKLSHDGWLSCHSCHTDGHSNGLLADTLGDGSFGTPKRVLSLLGVKDTGPWAWNGSMSELKDQVRKSILTTMHGPKPTEEQLADLEAFLRSLPPPPPVRRDRSESEEQAVRRGREVFGKQGCSGCHVPPAYTSGRTYDVGLADEAGNTAFNPPSLRGVGQGGPYFHDNRAATLEDVFVRHHHQLKGEPSQQEVADLVSFLRSL